MTFLYALPVALLIASPFPQADDAAAGSPDISEVDAIECRLDAPTYTGFAMSVDGEEHLARARHWKKIATANSFMDEYELPQPIVVAGSYSTRRIAFTSNAIIAILDLPDPATVARAAQVDNVVDADPMIDALIGTGEVDREQAEAEITFRKFLGERILKDVTEPADKGEHFGAHTIVARTVSNATTHPGKTFYGCSYRIEVLDEDGKPL